jgi:hypothetical protein
MSYGAAKSQAKFAGPPYRRRIATAIRVDGVVMQAETWLGKSQSSSPKPNQAQPDPGQKNLPPIPSL